jgi:hypothetical protein
LRTTGDVCAQVRRGPDEEYIRNGHHPPVFDWDNDFVLTAAAVQDCLAAMNMKTISQSHYLPVMASADYFLFTNMKAELMVISVMQEPFQKTWDGVLITISKDDFVTALQRWKEGGKNWFWNGVGNAKK